MSQPTDLELSIFRTLCWFSVFHYPLTTFEIWKWLLRPVRSYDLFEVTQSITNSGWLKEKLNQKDGFWTLRYDPNLSMIEERHKRFLNAIVKYRKLSRASYFFQLLPSLKTVASANTLAWWHTTNESDIDLYIMTDPNRIWSTRFFLVLPFAVCGNRPKRFENVKVNDPFCFSFFTTTEAIQMESLKCAQEDLYLAYWIKSLVPIIDRSDFFSQLSSVNRWVDVVLPNAHPRLLHPYHCQHKLFSIPIQWSLFESLFRFIQRRHFPSSIAELANKDSRVVVSDQILKFHNSDRRDQFMDEFKKIYEREIN
ncbi:hypothetical protein HYV69_00925 [Candidatus Uhrbacteria bacterium]|nr:hypothetical protein [Candidatus Uhrbacteria bacterium]